MVRPREPSATETVNSGKGVCWQLPRYGCLGTIRDVRPAGSEQWPGLRGGRNSKCQWEARARPGSSRNRKAAPAVDRGGEGGAAEEAGCGEGAGCASRHPQALGPAHREHLTFIKGVFKVTGIISFNIKTKN